MPRRYLAVFALCLILRSSTAAPLGAQVPPAQTLPLTLGDAVRFATAQSTVAQAARYLPLQARARARQARSALLPDISVQGADGQRAFNSTSLGFSFPALPGQPPLFSPTGEVIGPKRSIDYRGRLTLPLVDPGALGRLRSAQMWAGASTTDVAVAADQAAAAAALAYIQALRAEDECRARSADSALVADLVRMARDQLQAGVSISLDVTRAQARLAFTRAQLIAARGRRDRTRLDLLRALNLPLSTAIVLSDSLEALTVGELAADEQAAVGQAAVDQALATRPDLRAAEQRIAAARQSMAAVRAERLPSLRLVADYGVSGDHYSRLLNTYTYSVVFSASIFDGALRAGRLQEQTARLGEAEVQYQALRSQAEAEVRAARLDLTSAQAQVDAAREALRLAELEVAQSRDHFQGGVAGNADVIAALLARTAARVGLIDALAGVQNARVALAHARGAATTLR